MKPDFSQATEAVVRTLARRKNLHVLFGANLPSKPLALEEHPHLPPAEATPIFRAMADRVAIAYPHHDKAIHREHRPEGVKAASIFDALEMARIEALGAAHLQGTQANLAAFWEKDAREKGYGMLSERADPPLADLLSAILRQKTLGIAPPASLARLTQLWSGWVEEKAGKELQRLLESLHEQQDYALVSRKLIEAIGNVAEARPDSTDGSTEEAELQEEVEPTGEASAEQQPSPSAPREETEEETPSSKIISAMTAIEEPAGKSKTPYPGWWPNESQGGMGGQEYRIFTDAHDEVVLASKLASPEELTRLRQQMDDKLSLIPGVVGKLAAKLQRLLLATQARHYDFDLEWGFLDQKKLARIVADAAYPYPYMQEAETEFKDTIVTLLLDNSGSMRGRPITIAALSADILARTLERCGVKVEILGFTTRDWRGGEARKAWVQAGKSANPGRLNDLRHIIYKPADAPWRKTRKNLALMLKDGILKENIDGEALLWASERLLKRQEERKILMVISDGAPVDDATLSHNSGGYLDHHLREVIQSIEEKEEIELLAVGIGHDVTRYYKNAITLNDAEKLGETMLAEVSRLFTGGTVNKL